MYIKLIQPKKDGSKIYQNTGSVNQIISYLRHESNRKGEELNIFFNQSAEKICDAEVQEKMDKNSSKIKPDMEKFYSIIISPAEEELVHIGNDDAAIRKYVRQVMGNYAAGFQLKNSEQLGSKDLVWFAAIHSDREIKNIDLKHHQLLSLKEAQRVKMLNSSNVPSDQVEAGKILEKAREREMNRFNPDYFSAGDRKPGFHKHIHIIVSRMDASQTYHLNPRTRKAAFHIRGFQEKCARDFQHMFGYHRETLSTGFFQKYSERDQHYFNKKIAVTTDQINQHLADEKLDPVGLKEIGKECSFSRAFFINLTKLKYRFTQGDYVHDPYFFVKNGREQKQEEYLSKLGNTDVGGKKGKSEVSLDSENEHSVSKDDKGSKLTTEHMLQLLGSIRGGQTAIKETLMLDEERKKLKKHQEKGRGGDHIEMA